jgi:hypothetical protein
VKSKSVKFRVENDQFTLIVYENNSFVLMPPPRFIVAAAGSLCTGKITHGLLNQLFERWHAEAMRILGECGCYALRS